MYFYTSYHDTLLFKEETLPVLLENEAENNLLIASILKYEYTHLEDHVMGTVKSEKGEIQAIIGKVTPYSLCIYAKEDTKCQEVLSFLAKIMVERQIAFQGIVGNEHLIDVFSTFYSIYQNVRPRVRMYLNVYKLTELIPLVKAKGRLRPITYEDLYFLPYWLRDFQKDCHFPTSTLMQNFRAIEHIIKHQFAYIWEDDHPVSIAAKGRQFMNGCAVCQVYTPPYYRGKQYASSCVAALSEKLLAEGNTFTVLYADRNNISSNKVYQKMGYKLIGHVKDIVFTKY